MKERESDALEVRRTMWFERGEGLVCQMLPFLSPAR